MDFVILTNHDEYQCSHIEVTHAGRSHHPVSRRKKTGCKHTFQMQTQIQTERGTGATPMWMDPSIRHAAVGMPVLLCHELGHGSLIKPHGCRPGLNLFFI
jgi:hypothetical protein